MSFAASAPIFDLPPVLDLICEFIWTDDINSCRLVCKEWATLFDIYRWKHVYSDIPSLGLSGELCYNLQGPRSLEAIWKNSSRIRTLNITIAELAQLLELDQDTLPHLQELSLRSKYCCSSDDVAHVNEVFKFMTRPSSRLHAVSMSTAIKESHHRFNLGLLPGLAIHPALTELTLRAYKYSDPLVVLAILKNCPPTLHKLRVDCHCEGFDGPEKARKLAAIARESEEQYEWRRFESLRRLTVTCRLGGCESWVHHPILRNSPNLRCLRIGEYFDDDEVDFEGFRQTLAVIPTTCPKIEHLDVQQGGIEMGVSAEDLVRLVQSYPRGLRSFNFSMPESGGEQVFSAIIQTSATTLESVFLDHFYYSSTVSVETATRFVQECPLLEDFRMGCSCSQSPRCRHIELRQFVDSQNKRSDHFRWLYNF
ncbi:hypothetical protein EC957_011792 [Mortierella hygrophila]|uniref:F-box domain-containing protein n=1 Tax=Mortierella hygrophila TaxID=979708 RepID=A0A9P6F868_9FUNG|nr:hypothetical protein EC957_011792 [Mortierella hygrophila]